MYNEFILILLSVFAAFGVYAIIREIVMLCTKSRGIAIAVRFVHGADEMQVADMLLLAEHLAEKIHETERRPVILADRADVRTAEKFGYEVYVKQ